MVYIVRVFVVARTEYPGLWPGTKENKSWKINGIKKCSAKTNFNESLKKKDFY